MSSIFHNPPEQLGQVPLVRRSKCPEDLDRHAVSLAYSNEFRPRGILCCGLSQL